MNKFLFLFLICVVIFSSSVSAGIGNFTAIFSDDGGFDDDLSLWRRVTLLVDSEFPKFDFIWDWFDGDNFLLIYVIVILIIIVLCVIVIDLIFKKRFKRKRRKKVRVFEEVD